MPPTHKFDDPDAGFCTLFIANMNTQSRGDVKLVSSDPKEPPLINPNYLADPFDLVNLREATKVAMTLMKTPTMTNQYIKPILAPQSQSDEDVTVTQSGDHTETNLADMYDRTLLRTPPLDCGTRAVLFRWGRVRRMEAVWVLI